MATKNIVRTLNEDTRRVSLFVADAASGDNAGHLVAQVHLDTDGGPGTPRSSR